MSLKEHVYSVLLVSASDKLNNGLIELFPPSKYNPVNIVGNVSAAKRALAERDFDFVIINSPLSDDNGTRFSIDTSGQKNNVVLLLAHPEQYADYFDKVAEFGVFVLAKPLSKTSFSQVLDLLVSARERLRQTEKKVLSVEEKMEEIRLVNRAKWLLIRELKMNEPDAHRYIEKQSMDTCVPRRRIAEEIISMYG